MNELRGVLEFALKNNNTVSFNSLRNKKEFRDFVIPSKLKKMPVKPTIHPFVSKIEEPGALAKLIPGRQRRYEEELKKARLDYEVKARHDFEVALKKYEELCLTREEKIKTEREKYEQVKRKFELKIQAENQEVDRFKKLYLAGNPDAVTTYFTMVLERSLYPEGFPQEFRIAYLPDPKELVIEYELPNKDIVPAVFQYRYVKTNDEITQKPRSNNEIKTIYQHIVASICLRTIHEIFKANQGKKIDVIVFNGFVQTIDPATGKDIRPHLISVRTTKERFTEINLSRIEVKACLKNLGAKVSPSPDEMIAIKPIVEFDMVDKRFVEESDVLSDLESRPNLMDLNPFEFENLIVNLFDQMGFQSKLTRSRKDGGIDAVAFDSRPIVGGKLVIQAKRYKHVVGVAAVRDLYGTMINEGANKGILVTTSHYGPDAYEFAKDKPIEFIDGSGLLYLLEQQGVKARIVFPEE